MFDPYGAERRSRRRQLPDDHPPRPAVRRGRLPAPVPALFSHTWLDRGGPEGDLMELNGLASPQMLRRYGASARSARCGGHDDGQPAAG